MFVVICIGWRDPLLLVMAMVMLPTRTRAFVGPARARCATSALPFLLGTEASRAGRVLSSASAAAALALTRVRFDPKLVCDELLETCRVPAVFDVVLAPGRVKVLGSDLNPPLTKLFVALPKGQVVLAGEREMVDVRVEVVDPPVPDLLPNTARQALSQIRPASEGLLRAGRDNLHDDRIFVIRPLALTNTRLEVPDPSLVALLGTITKKQ